MSDLFAAYQDTERRRPAYDEMYAGTRLRPTYEAVHDALAAMSHGEVHARADSLASSYLDQGVTFGVDGEERPFPLDIVPRLIEPESWQQVEQGVSQRVRALERFLDDVYGAADIFGRFRVLRG